MPEAEKYHLLMDEDFDNDSSPHSRLLVRTDSFRSRYYAIGLGFILLVSTALNALLARRYPTADSGEKVQYSDITK